MPVIKAYPGFNRHRVVIGVYGPQRDPHLEQKRSFKPKRKLRRPHAAAVDLSPKDMEVVDR
jgi:hypothetical protein